MKQETIEEAGAIAAGLCEHLEAKEQAMFIAGFQECAKWQAEKMYSEEEAYKIWKAGQEYWKTSGESITFEELIEQFKKK